MRLPCCSINLYHATFGAAEATRKAGVGDDAGLAEKSGQQADDAAEGGMVEDSLAPEGDGAPDEVAPPLDD